MSKFGTDPEWLKRAPRPRKRPDRRLDHQFVPDADIVLVGEVKFGRNRHDL